MKYIYIIFFGILFLFDSCVRDAKNITLPETSPKLVVSCFISSEDTLLQAVLSWSTPLNQYDNQQKTHDLQLANVIISDGTNQVNLLYTDTMKYVNNASNAYFINSTNNFPIIPGRIYFLKATANSGEVITAATTVPLTKNSTLDFQSYASTDSDNEYLIDFSLKDEPETNNFYRLGILTSFTFGCNGGNLYFEDESSFISDAGKDGQILRLHKGHVQSSCPGNSSDSVSIYLASIDANYYKFHKALEDFSGDDPFSEPAQIYSNVTGGLGAFGSYRLFIKKIPLHL